MKTAYFYLLKDETLRTYSRSVCHIVDRLCGEGSSVYLYCQDAEIAQQFDDELWTFKDIRFVPHGLVTDTEFLKVTVPTCIIGFSEGPDNPVQSTVLFNLANPMPKSFKQYEQIIEVVPVNEEGRKGSRERYKHYQRAGYAIKTQTYDLS